MSKKTQKLNLKGEVNPEFLCENGIQVPKGSTSFHTEGSQILFHVNIWPDDCEHYQGDWKTEKVELTENQLEFLRNTQLIGSMGGQLGVLTSRGFQG